MKKLYKKIESLNKIIIFTSFLLIPAVSFADLSPKKWTKECQTESSTTCYAGIIFEISLPDSDKKKILSTVYIQVASTTEQKMALIDEKEKTYKLKEQSTSIPILFINLPLSVNLQKNPLIQIDKKNITNIKYSHCNTKTGCVTNLAINDKIVEQFKEGKELTVIFGINGREKNMSINFPLKGFSKSYRALLK
tara:strand:+ start:304 stop:882 length:579 start_codon:yes stop_codon:yes gene_type:complete